MFLRDEFLAGIRLVKLECREAKSIKIASRFVIANSEHQTIQGLESMKHRKQLCISTCSRTRIFVHNDGVLLNIPIIMPLIHSAVMLFYSSSVPKISLQLPAFLSLPCIAQLIHFAIRLQCSPTDGITIDKLLQSQAVLSLITPLREEIL